MAKELHKEILDLKKEVLEMGDFGLQILQNAVKSLNDQDVNLANSILAVKQKIREYDALIEDKALKLIALYQPMAIDLRRLACMLKMNTYLARIGRYGKDIAAVTLLLSERPVALKIVNLQHLQEHVAALIKDALKAFDEEDIKIIENFQQRDNEIDALRWSIFRECITYMMEDPKYITTCAHYIMVARYLERCGDHACKIAEKIYYVVTGKHIEIA